MQRSASLPASLGSFLWPVRGQTSHDLARALSLVVAGVGLLTISAKVQIPFWPVPMTLQTLAIMLVGLIYGRTLAAATVTSYLALGALGAPVFAAGGGIAYMIGPTGGYLLGFLVAAVVLGHLGDRGFSNKFAKMAIAMALGNLIIFACGLAWLATIIGPAKALAAGLYPFVPAELVKAAVAVVAMPMVWRLVHGQKDRY